MEVQEGCPHSVPHPHLHLCWKGGTIGLHVHSTCYIARLVMVWWDRQLLSILKTCNISLEERMRYMDDIRLWCHYIRLGLRWTDGDLREVRGMTGLEKTLEVIKAIMNEICTFLTITMEGVRLMVDSTTI